MPEPSIHTENQWLRQLAGGDQKALQYFYDKYYSPLVFFSLNITGDRLQSEDIALECFVKLWQHRNTIESDSKMRGFLFSAARNACLDQLRHNQVKNNAHQQISSTQSDTALPEAAFVMTEVVKMIYEEIREMPEGYRKIIELLFIEERSPAEAAEQLGLSMDNLRQRKGRALRYLKNELVKKGLDSLIISLIFFKI